MAYLFQTFSIGQILTAAQMNQVEASIRDHVHGEAGVVGFTIAQLNTAVSDADIAPIASPVFTTQITTPKIVTASGNLEILPAGNAHVVLQGSGTGNVGIGTATPTAKLDVNGNIQAALGSGLIWSGTAAAVLSNSNELYFYSGNSLVTSKMVLAANGYVGIGTATPGNLLHVKNDAANGQLRLGGVTETHYWDIGRNGTADGRFTFINAAGGAGTERVSILPTGNVGIGTATPTAKLDVNGNIQAALGSGLIWSGTSAAVLSNSNELYFYSGNSLVTSKMVLDATGNVGIGTATPSALLSVGSTSQFQVNSSGVVAAGTVPLARMMRGTETLGSSAVGYIDINIGTVVGGDRILIQGYGTSTAGMTYITAGKSAGGAGVDFAGAGVAGTTVPTYTTYQGSISTLLRVTTSGTLTLQIAHNGTGTLATYGSIIVLNNG